MSDALDRISVNPAPPTYRSPPVPRPGRPRKRNAPLSNGSPKVKAAINLMIWGGDDGIPMKRPEAAKAVGLSDITLRQALGNPLVFKFYNEQLEVLRSSKRPRALHTIADLSENAAGEAVKLRAAIYLDGGDKPGGVNVNVQVNSIVPGYQVTIPQAYASDAPQLMKLAGSTRNVLEQSQSVPHEDADT